MLSNTLDNCIQVGNNVNAPFKSLTSVGTMVAELSAFSRNLVWRGSIRISGSEDVL